MDRVDMRPRDLLWVCLTKSAVRNFARRGDGEPYTVYVGEDALVLCTDGEGGYLLLFEAKRLGPEVIERFERYRAEEAGGDVGHTEDERSGEASTIERSSPGGACG
jgi:hypothetical protein